MAFSDGCLESAARGRKELSAGRWAGLPVFVRRNSLRGAVRDARIQ